MTLRSQITIALSAIALSGCAAVVDGSTQIVQVESIPASGANCVLSNSRGQWNVVTPGAVAVKKSQSVLKATCSLAGYQDSIAYLAPTQSSQAIIGAVLFWGVVENAVDASTGAGNDYPSPYTIHLKAAAPAPQAAAAAQ